MSDEMLTVAAEPTQDERTMALLAQVLQLVGWWIAPLIIFLIKRESKFVSFHALQALLLQITYMIVCGALMVLFFMSAFTSMAHPTNGNNAPPPAFFVFFPLAWLGFMGMWVAMLVVAIVYGIKAGRGEWAEYPLLGRLARRFLKIGSGGVPLQA
ncbi:MAG TPA: DUF4870 domain-containing protein [Terriglobales bacterium]|jgi:uncharacterized Tic20 family protein|nr:DUF4870 domain-containing protein [Terriglobales bacterium]